MTVITDKVKLHQRHQLQKRLVDMTDEYASFDGSWIAGYSEELEVVLDGTFCLEELRAICKLMEQAAGGK